MRYTRATGRLTSISKVIIEAFDQHLLKLQVATTVMYLPMVFLTMRCIRGTFRKNNLFAHFEVKTSVEMDRFLNRVVFGPELLRKVPTYTIFVPIKVRYCFKMF